MVAVKVKPPPKIDAVASEAVCDAARAATVGLENGANFEDGKIRVLLKAVCSGDTLSVLAQQHAGPILSPRAIHQAHRRSPEKTPAPGGTVIPKPAAATKTPRTARPSS